MEVTVSDRKLTSVGPVRPVSRSSEDAGVSQTTGRWVTQRPDAERLRPVELSDGTVIRVKHRTLGCVRSSVTRRVWSVKIGFGPLLEMTGR